MGAETELFFLCDKRQHRAFDAVGGERSLAAAQRRLLRRPSPHPAAAARALDRRIALVGEDQSQGILSRVVIAIHVVSFFFGCALARTQACAKHSTRGITR